MANVENILLWTAALRSGKYPQGKGLLNADGKLCCLGVACELAVKAGVPVEVMLHTDSYGRAPMETMYDYQSAVLPPAVRDWLGLDAMDPVGVYNGEYHPLSKLNDDGAFNFADIADIIERTYASGETEAWWDRELVNA